MVNSVFVILSILAHFPFPQVQFATPSIEIEVSDVVSLAEIYRGGLQRIELLNWLDPMRTGSPSPFHRSNIFANPTVAELRMGWQNAGGVRIVNCLNPVQTDFPHLTLPDLLELGAGPYLVKLARSYLTAYRVKVAQRLPYVNIDTYHSDRSQPNLYMYGFTFDQQAPPANWYGVWPGCSVPGVANIQPWEPVRILVLPKLPSRYKSNCDHTVAVAYVPQHLPLQRPTPGFTSPALQRVKMYCCGPRYGKRNVFLCFN